MVVLGVVVAAGLVAALAWGSLDLRRPWQDEAPRPLSAPEVLRRYVWYVAVMIAAGLGSGLVIIGAGGRLAMRLLAVTAGDAAQGRITEAEQIVGRITMEGTVGFITFFGIFGGLTTGALYMIVQRWLPGGYWRGLTFGALLLVLFGTRIEPLRASNLDFDIVGPGWLSVVVFVALGLAHGMLLAAIAGRYSRALPLISRDVTVLASYAPLLALGPAFPVLIPIAVLGLIAVTVGRDATLRRSLAAGRVTVAGRVIGLVFAAIALPGFVSAIVDIVGRA